MAARWAAMMLALILWPVDLAMLGVSLAGSLLIVIIEIVRGKRE